MRIKRKPTEREINLLNYLIDKAHFAIPQDWKDCLLVSPMNDGGMGSLTLFFPFTTDRKRSFGKQISDCTFTDTDGVEVIVSLYADTNGDLYELDIWKTDFSPMKQIPMNNFEQVETRPDNSIIQQVKIKKNIYSFLKEYNLINENHFIFLDRTIYLTGNKLYFDNLLDKLTMLLVKEGLEENGEEVNAIGEAIEDTIDAVTAAIDP
ncbi:MAG: DUF6984 family protein [Alistipes sp.]|jgi:hypothetical protein|uniref:DUF6984 family protein n=5 Tax=Rikenellaceae TaxID=171550 RepID=UPI001D45B2F6|nr:hypothetical protein [Alistipes sp.]MBS6100582.1 hypothetical protein [Alistipes sp.]HJI18730.1 hypothetical protein [Rikenellaceae bacterium]